MIYINRQKRDENKCLIRPSKEWFKKAQTATKMAILEKDKHKWDANIYADKKEVRAALEKLFGKCAYCEKPLPEEWDVEHFRPKGKVAERKDHPGYYWLGYEWENLYPSCKQCNQRRKDKPLWDDRRELPAEGKSYQFPLYGESTRAMTPKKNIEKEYTLLIDPCYDNPEWYLGYDPKGQIFALDDNNPFGDKSIKVYNLKRRRLVLRRKKVMKSTIRTLLLMKILKKTKPVNREALGETRGILLELISDKAGHAGVARYVKNNPDIFLG